MKIGNLIRFKETGAIASIINISDSGRFVDLYVADGTLDGTPSNNGYTGMTMSSLKRAAEVVSDWCVSNCHESKA